MDCVVEGGGGNNFAEPTKEFCSDILHNEEYVNRIEGDDGLGFGVLWFIRKHHHNRVRE